MDESSSHADGPSMGPADKPENAKTNDPCCHGPIDKEKRRNLVISIDGTSNKFGSMNTNVIEHHSLLEDEHQILYYNSGIGTYARPSWTSPKFIGMVLHHKIDLAIAWDFDKTVKDAYRWISDKYESGDLIFMFGFSRGAFQVRVLSAMIEKTCPKLDSSATSVAFSPDGKWLASVHRDGTVRTWDPNNIAQTGNVLPGQHSRRPTISSVTFSPDSKHLVSGSFDNTIKLWDIEKMEQVGDPWKGHTNAVRCVAFSPDGTKVVSASDDETLRLWDPKTGKEIAVLEGHEDCVQSVAFSPDGLHIASGSRDHTVGGPLKGHTRWVWSVAYSPNGKQIASGSLDNMIRLWDATAIVQVGEPRLLGHSDCVSSVSFSPDGKLLASGSDDRTIRIWNANTGARIGEGLRGHSDWVGSVAFSPDGKQMASASSDMSIRIWDIESYMYLHSIGSGL
ncbi:WD40 repeat-like protein [Agrocybe pediades]|nr:WD40 repeat-like protein [Agrocybe pediades]